MGMKQYRFKLLKKCDKLIDENKFGEAEKKISKLLNHTYPKLDEKEEENLRDFVEEKFEEREENLRKMQKESKRKTTTHKKRKHLREGTLKAQNQCLSSIQKKLTNLLQRHELVPE